MILTLYYMYATFVQWWRIGALKQKLNGTLNPQNALLLTSATQIADPKGRICVENLLFEKEGRVACTIVPRQKLTLNQWVLFPRDPRSFPIHIGASRGNLQGQKLYLLLQAHLDSYTPHQYEHVKLEQYGEPVAWRVSEQFEVILKTDLSSLTKLMNCFSYADMSINHDLRLVTMELVDVEGHPSKIKYDRKYSRGEQLNFSRVPVHWKRFVATVRHTYSKLNEGLHPKIMIENGTKPEDKKVPISEVKPIKKVSEKVPAASKNTLEVHGHSGRHRKREVSNDTTTANKTSKTEPAKPKEEEKDMKPKEEHKETKTLVEQKEVKPEAPPDIVEVKASKSVPIEANGVKAKEVLDTKAKDDKTTKGKEKLPKGKSADVKLAKGKSVDEKAVKGNDKESKSKAAKETKSKSVDKATSKKNEKPAEAKKPDLDKNRLSVTKPKRSAESGDSKKAKSCSEAAQSSGGASSKNLQRQNATSSKETSPNRVVKPPNILVYADSVVAKENVKSVLKSIINKEKYTIYDLPVNTAASFWDSSTTLVIVCGSVPPNLTPHLLQYLVTGGQLLCLCSDLLYSVLQTFSTAEVREHELVRFTYGDWKRVKMMHHIFCYQASPAKKQFSKDSDQSSHSSNGSSPVAPRTPSAVEIQHNGKNYIIQVQVLGAEETWQTPSLLLATVKDSLGKSVFSQVHLEVDPSQYQDDESKYAALKDSDKARLEIMKHLLSTHLDIDCKTFNQNVTYTPAYFLGRHDHKLEFLNGCRHIDNNKLMSDGLELEFCGKGVDPGTASTSRLPVFILSCPTNFSTVSYFETLKTEHLGRLVIYSDVLTSSQNVLQTKLWHGIAVIPKQQIEGKGRSDNEWLSPEGCAMFSLQLHVNLKSPLGQSLPLIQHMVMVAVILGIKKIPGLENLDIGLKWPNDLYAYSSIKIGGLIVNSTVENDMAVINIGCGVNLNNREPTLCINEIISRYCTEHKVHIAPLEPEKFFALVFNEIENVTKIVQSGDTTYLYDMYYKYWLHNNASITVNTKDGEVRDVLVKGIDNCGFLLVQSSDGISSSVQPDGNSFDMLKGLIAPKIS